MLVCFCPDRFTPSPVGGGTEAGYWQPTGCTGRLGGGAIEPTLGVSVWGDSWALDG